MLGLITMSDVERITLERKAQFKPARDSHFRLICGAAVSATRNYGRCCSDSCRR